MPTNDFEPWWVVHFRCADCANSQAKTVLKEVPGAAANKWFMIATGASACILEMSQVWSAINFLLTRRPELQIKTGRKATSHRVIIIIWLRLVKTGRNRAIYVQHKMTRISIKVLFRAIKPQVIMGWKAPTKSPSHVGSLLIQIVSPLSLFARNY